MIATGTWDYWRGWEWFTARLFNEPLTIIKPNREWYLEVIDPAHPLWITARWQPNPGRYTFTAQFTVNPTPTHDAHAEFPDRAPEGHWPALSPPFTPSDPNDLIDFHFGWS